MNSVIKFFATALGTGYLPLTPGTAGSAVGVLLFWAVSGLSFIHYVVFVAVFILFASWVADKAQGVFGKKDPTQITIDEVAGFLVAMAGHSWSWKAVVIGFVLFRLFDITKPFPIRRIENRLSNGFGVVLDDVLAGVYASIVLNCLLKFSSL